MSSQNTDPLLNRLVAGDEQAFLLLYQEFGARLLRTATAILGSHQDAEDVVQEVFVALVRSHRRLAEVNDLAAYLFTALRHAAGRVGMERCKNIQQSDDLQKVPQSNEHVDSIANHELRVDLMLALEQIPPEQREIVTFRLAGKLTFAQIAETLGISTQTAASRYRYALEKLRVLLKERQ
jgi:RNA polymerase sigma-70 factor, ECF subfamily